MIKKGIATVAQQHYAGYASEFWQKETSGENSLPTPSPQGEHKDHCAKLDWWVDAVAVANILRKIWLHSIYKHLLQNIIIKYFTLLRWVG